MLIEDYNIHHIILYYTNTQEQYTNRGLYITLYYIILTHRNSMLIEDYNIHHIILYYTNTQEQYTNRGL